MSDSNRQGNGRVTLRLPSPPLRAAGWMIAVVVLVAIAIWLAGIEDAFRINERNYGDRLELVAIAASAMTAIFAAFLTADLEYARWWSLLPIPPIVFWLGICVSSCLDRMTLTGPSAWTVDGCLDCVLFILTVSIPLGISLIVFLHRSQRSVHLPVRAAMLAGIGVAATAIGLLQIEHPVETNLADLTAHIVAASLVIGVFAYSPSLLPSYRR